MLDHCHEASITATVVGQLIEHWKEPAVYAQFNNDAIFLSPHDASHRITRLGLSLGVVPVFVPRPRPGFQVLIDGLNGTWQAPR